MPVFAVLIITLALVVVTAAHPLMGSLSAHEDETPWHHETHPSLTSRSGCSAPAYNFDENLCRTDPSADPCMCDPSVYATRDTVRVFHDLFWFDCMNSFNCLSILVVFLDALQCNAHPGCTHCIGGKRIQLCRSIRWSQSVNGCNFACDHTPKVPAPGLPMCCAPSKGSAPSMGYSDTCYC